MNDSQKNSGINSPTELLFSGFAATGRPLRNTIMFPSPSWPAKHVFLVGVGMTGRNAKIVFENKLITRQFAVALKKFGRPFARGWHAALPANARRRRVEARQSARTPGRRLRTKAHLREPAAVSLWMNSQKINAHFHEMFGLPIDRTGTVSTGIDLDRFSPAGPKADAVTA